VRLFGIASPVRKFALHVLDAENDVDATVIELLETGENTVELPTSTHLEHFWRAVWTGYTIAKRSHSDRKARELVFGSMSASSRITENARRVHTEIASTAIALDLPESTVSRIVSFISERSVFSVTTIATALRDVDDVRDVARLFGVAHDMAQFDELLKEEHL